MMIISLAAKQLNLAYIYIVILYHITMTVDLWLDCIIALMVQC